MHILQLNARASPGPWLTFICFPRITLNHSISKILEKISLLLLDQIWNLVCCVEYDVSNLYALR